MAYAHDPVENEPSNITISGLLKHTEDWLDSCEGYLSEIEDRISGPRPRPMETSASKAEVQPMRGAVDRMMTARDRTMKIRDRLAEIKETL